MTRLVFEKTSQQQSGPGPEVAQGRVLYPTAPEVAQGRVLYQTAVAQGRVLYPTGGTR